MRSKGVARGGGGGGAPPISGGSQKYIRGDPCDLGSEAKNRGSGPPAEMGGPPPRNQILATPLVRERGSAFVSFEAKDHPGLTSPQGLE